MGKRRRIGRENEGEKWRVIIDKEEREGRREEG